MSNPILIIDNNLELELIEKQHPELLDAPLILLSSNFPPQQLELYNKRGYSYFDDLITKEEAIHLSKKMHHLIWSWFIDENNNDLSVIDGCSLGAAFSSSLEIIFSALIRYTTGLKKLLIKNHIVYVSSRTAPLCLDIVVALQKSIGFSLSQVEIKESKQQQFYGKNAITMDAGGRYRDLTPLFKHGNVKDIVICIVLKLFQNNSNRKKQVVFIPNGKTESFFEHVKQSKYCRVNWSIPLDRESNLFFKKNKKILYHYFSNLGSKRSKEIKIIIQDLKYNIQRCQTTIDSGLLIKAMERYTFSNFIGAYNYYLNALSTFKANEPELVILSADNFETNILVAQAAKQTNVQTAITSHGLNLWGTKQFREGIFKVFDYALAYGKQDVDFYENSGIQRNNIYITAFPYFERFLPIRKNNSSKIYKSALVLTPDKFNNTTLEKTDSEFKYYKEVYTLLKKLGIKILGIKARFGFHFKNIGLIDDVLVIDGHSIPLLSGYKSFPDAVKNADMIIGPASTALIEAGLMGKDYFVYQHTAFHEFVPNMNSLFYNYVNVSFDMEQLRGNILKKQPYQQGCSINDLIDLKENKTKDDLYNKFESGIESILEAGGMSGPYPSPKKHNLFSVRNDSWKLIYHKTTDEYELYDMLRDPKERNNIFGTQKEIERSLKKLINVKHPGAFGKGTG
jgi:hypothetical protein